MSSTFSHVGLNCKDPIEMEKFYTKFFGFERARVYNPGAEQVVMLKKDDIYLELFPAEGQRPKATPEEDGYSFPGVRHIAFLVDDLDSLLKELDEEVEISMGPIDMDDLVEGMRVCWIKDPEGNIVELNQGYVDQEDPPPLEG